MTYGPCIDQRSLSPFGSEDCGESCIASVLQHLGHNVTAQQVLSHHAGATSLPDMVGLAQQFGLKGVTLTSGGFTNNDALAICLIHDNAYADPAANGQYEHYIVVYAQDSNNVYAMNPWGGTLKTYPLSQFNPAYQDAIVIPISINTVGPASATGETEMALSADMKNGLAVLASIACLGRERGAIDGQFAGSIGDNGENFVEGLQSIAMSKESGDWFTTIREIPTLVQQIAALQAEVTALKAAPHPTSTVDPAAVNAALAALTHLLTGH